MLLLESVCLRMRVWRAACVLHRVWLAWGILCVVVLVVVVLGVGV